MARRSPSIARAIAAGCVLTVIVIGFPLVFTRVGTLARNGWPSLSEVTGWMSAPLSTATVLQLLTGIGWLLWAWFIACLLIETLNLSRRGAAAIRLPFSAVPQHLARRLLAALLLVGTVGPTATATALAAEAPRPAALTALWNPQNDPTASASAKPGAAPQNIAAHRGPGRAEGVGDSDGITHARPPVATTQGRATAEPSAAQPADLAGLRRVVVRPPNGARHDCLWDIAVAHLGDGARWRDIYALNRTPTPGGVVITDPDLIDIGWNLRMPADATGLALWTDAAPASPAPSAPPVPSVPSAPSALPTPSVPVPAAPVAPSTGQHGGATSSQTSPASPTATASSHAQNRPAGTSSAATAPSAPVESTDAASISGHAAPTTPDTPAAGAGAVDGDGAGTPVGAYAAIGGTGAALLAGCALLALHANRRRQLRHRRPGRAIGTPAPGLRAVERALMVNSPTGLRDVRLLDTALRMLTVAVKDAPPDHVPDVIAAHLNAAGVHLRLLTPLHEPPAPWSADEDGLWWSLAADPELLPPQELAIFPALTSIGYLDQDPWLLDLERAQTIAVHGDAQRCAALARYMAAELALNTWSDQVRVSMIGFGQELVDLAPDRLRYLPGTAEDLAALAADLGRMTHLSHLHGDAVAVRLDDAGLEIRPPHIVLVAGPVADDPDRLATLTNALGPEQIRTGAAVVFTTRDEPQAASGTGLYVDGHGQLRIEELDLTITAHALTEEEARGIAGLLAATRDLTDEPMPTDDGPDPWRAYATSDGNLRPEHTLPRRITLTGLPTDTPQPPTRPAPRIDPAHIPLPMPPRPPHPPDPPGPPDPPDVPASVPDESRAAQARPGPEHEPPRDEPGRDEEPVGAGLLPEPDQTYRAAAAVTDEDLALLAPRTVVGAAGQIEDADPTLDAEFAAWHDQDSVLPKLSVLGPITLRTAAPPPVGRGPGMTELVTYLALRPQGSSTEEVATALKVATSTARKRLSEVRTLLGAHPETGEPFLPDARESQPGAARGVRLYVINGILTDADLFRRLRLRGQARGGPAGLADLEAALNLVAGPPFSQTREGGFDWLAEGQRIDHILGHAIVDVAHTLATSYLNADDPQGAQRLIEVGLTGAPYDETLRLDMAAVREAMLDKAAAERYLRTHVTERAETGDTPEELPTRTRQIIADHNWLTRENVG